MNFSFVYDGKPYVSTDLPKEVKSKSAENGVHTHEEVYTLDLLRFTRIVKEFPNGAEYALTYVENAGHYDSQILSNLLDADDAPELSSPSPAVGFTGYGKSGYLKLYAYKGSRIEKDDFGEEERLLEDGRTHAFIAEGGRSSELNLPFFDLSLDGCGCLYAVGWTGRWRAAFTKDEQNKHTRVEIGVHDVHFYLKPGERIRTASVLKLPYENGRTAAHNAMKRTIKDYFVADRIKREPLPFCAAFWGGSTTDFMLRRLDEMKKKELPFDCFWIDAGWYGDYEEYCPTEFHPAWGTQAGNWFPNANIHPKGLKDVSEKAHACGYKFLLWFEPERADVRSRLYKEKKHWFLRRKEDPYNALINLAQEEPRQYLVDLIGDYIENLNIDVYRQDFNIDATPYWVENEPAERKGLLQIKYVMGLYAFWDALLARFPSLLIDNCASGGKRIDLETISRSVPLWRSDYQCLFDRDAEALQTHTMGLSTFVPYSGSGVGQIMDDLYRRRSCYSAAMGSNFIGYESLTLNGLDFDIASAVREFQSVREYFSCDYYPVFGYSAEHTSWAGWQFDRPEHGDGILMAFRRDESVNDRAAVKLGGLQTECDYEFTDADGGEPFVVSGKVLTEEGLSVVIPEMRQSKLYRYRKIKGGKNE